jgi:hypothetical protein
LAAAYAEAGDFVSAVEWAEKSLQMTVDKELRGKIEDHLACFRQGQPWREAPMTARKASVHAEEQTNE